MSKSENIGYNSGINNGYETACNEGYFFLPDSSEGWVNVFLSDISNSFSFLSQVRQGIYNKLKNVGGWRVVFYSTQQHLLFFFFWRMLPCKHYIYFYTSISIYNSYENVHIPLAQDWWSNLGLMKDKSSAFPYFFHIFFLYKLMLSRYFFLLGSEYNNGNDSNGRPKHRTTFKPPAFSVSVYGEPGPARDFFWVFKVCLLWNESRTWAF